MYVNYYANNFSKFTIAWTTLIKEIFSNKTY